MYTHNHPQTKMNACGYTYTHIHAPINPPIHTYAYTHTHIEIHIHAHNHLLKKLTRARYPPPPIHISANFCLAPWLSAFPSLLILNHIGTVFVVRCPKLKREDTYVHTNAHTHERSFTHLSIQISLLHILSFFLSLPYSQTHAPTLGISLIPRHKKKFSLYLLSFSHRHKHNRIYNQTLSLSLSLSLSLLYSHVQTYKTSFVHINGYLLIPWELIFYCRLFVLILVVFLLLFSLRFGACDAADRGVESLRFQVSIVRR